METLNNLEDIDDTEYFDVNIYSEYNQKMSKYFRFLI